MRFKFTDYWYRESVHPYLFLLLPFSWLFGCLSSTRKKLYQWKILTSARMPGPVIIVGNITVGGTGKTPFVIWLAHLLQRAGYKPGIITRGCGGKGFKQPYLIKPHDDVSMTGDEALLLHEKTKCPVIICDSKAKAAAYLFSQTSCNICISDDGLQHYALERDIEIAIIDGERKLGNGQLLPAGPLREKKARLTQVDFIVNNGDALTSYYKMHMRYEMLVSVIDANVKLPIETFAPHKVHAVAAIGNPQRFFNGLSAINFSFNQHIFPDHYRYQAQDFPNDDLPIIMTEKDAVKCREFADKRFWFIQTSLSVCKDLERQILSRLAQEKHV